MRKTLSVLVVAAAAFLSIPAAAQAAPRADKTLQDIARGAGDLAQAQYYHGRRVYRGRVYRGGRYYGRRYYAPRRAYGYYGRGYGYAGRCGPGWSWQSGMCKPYRGY